MARSRTSTRRAPAKPAKRATARRPPAKRKPAKRAPTRTARAKPAKRKRPTKSSPSAAVLAAARQLLAQAQAAPPEPPTTAASPHVDRAIAYARGVVSGDIVAGHWTRRAAQRFLDDLERQSTDAYPYRFAEAAAERFCRFAGRLRHYKGPLAGKLFELQDWQCFVSVNLFGWLDKATGHRRFRRFYLEVARGNGKSYFLAVIALYMAFADGEPGAEVYSAATTRAQAKIVWEAGREIVRRAPELQRALGVALTAHSIVQVGSASSFLALASEDHTLDGLNSHLAAIDELHAHKTRGVYDVLETSISKRSQPLLATITTAGSDRTGICYEVRTDLTKILDGTAVDETFFGVIYTLDDDDDWRDTANWLKANPNLGVSVNTATLADIARKAERLPAAQAAFKTKHLNIWVGANSALFSIDAWNACADPGLTREQFAGETCIVAIDLATKNDLAPVVETFARDVDGLPHYYVFARHYLPRNAVDDGRNAQYSGWETEGWLTVTETESTDQAQIEADILAASDLFTIEEVCYDPWQATGLAQRLIAEGATVVEVKPTVANFSEATKTLGALMLERRIHHNGDPVLAWAVSNVVGHYDAKENVYPRKERPENKIDPAVALVMALSRWLRRELDTDSVYSERGILSA